MTSKKVEGIIEKEGITLVRSNNPFEEYLNTISHYHKPVISNSQDSQIDYSEMQGSHYWI